MTEKKNRQHHHQRHHDTNKTSTGHDEQNCFAVVCSGRSPHFPCCSSAPVQFLFKLKWRRNTQGKKCLKNGLHTHTQCLLCYRCFDQVIMSSHGFNCLGITRKRTDESSRTTQEGKRTIFFYELWCHYINCLFSPSMRCAHDVNGGTLRLADWGAN